MQTTQSNGHAGHAQPAATALPAEQSPEPAPDPFEPIRAAVRSLMSKSYDEGYAKSHAVGFADGFRRATQHLARVVGSLDGESKAKVLTALDLLEAELHKAEEAAK